MRDTSRIKVMLLGDSFTWGHSTENKTSSFANTLLARGYWVYNTGISGVDVAQYLQVLKVYFDSILPDVVILNFYMGNDVSYHARTPTAGVPVFFSTNAGNIMSFQDGIQFTDKDLAYRNMMDEMTIPKTTWLNRLASTTVFGTMAWHAALKLGIVHRTYLTYPSRTEIPYCNDEILQVSQFCRSRGVPFVLSVIPNLENGNLNRAHSVNRLFENMDFVEPDMQVDMFNAHDGHFNEIGHRHYADYLERLIKEAVGNKVYRN